MDIINIASLHEFKKYAVASTSFANDYIFMQIASSHIKHLLPATFRLEGMAIMLCIDGASTVRINFHETEIVPGTLLTIDPHFLIEPNMKPGNGFEAYMIFMSREFLSAFHFDTKAYPGLRNRANASPIFSLSPERMGMVMKYFELLKINARNTPIPSIYSMNVARSVICALIYQLLDYDFDDIQENNPFEQKPEDLKMSFRSVKYASAFMRLVRDNYRTQRSVQFYAQKLFITPKYLTKIIKEQTGRSAKEWIENHVLVEAKKLIRYSDKDIQQIAYEMNFPSQSEFARFFKRHTGLQPSTFRSNTQ